MLLAKLRQILGAENVKTGSSELVAYSQDNWPRHQIRKMQGDHERVLPMAVAYPEATEAVQAVLREANAVGVPVVSAGAQSGVCGGASAVSGGIVLNLSRMNRVLDVDERNLTIRVEAGALGEDVEAELNGRGFTLGHFPSTTMAASIGGWLATRSAGQRSSRYGKIEDMVVGLEAVLPSGQLLECGAEQSVDYTQLLVGSEGTLGTIVSATLRISIKPEVAAYRGYRFRNVEAAQLAVRQIMQLGLSPHVVRLYDAFDSLLHSSSASGDGATALLNPVRFIFGGGAGQAPPRTGSRLAMLMALGNASALNRIIEMLPVSCLLTIGFEGAAAHVQEDMGRAQRIMQDAGGVDGGDLFGNAGGDSALSLNQAAVFAAGAFVDTMEVSCMWSNVMDVYHAVREAVRPHALIKARFSHAYRDGCAIDFTFAGYKRNPHALERLYDLVWNAALNAAVGAGASASHHHGIGSAKLDIMRREHGAGIRLLYGLKDAMDPQGIMNPGKLLPNRAVKE